MCDCAVLGANTVFCSAFNTATDDSIIFLSTYLMLLLLLWLLLLPLVTFVAVRSGCLSAKNCVPDTDSLGFILSPADRR